MTNNWEQSYDAIRVGVNKWNLPTLIISSFEDLNGKIPSLFKKRFGFALERKGAGHVVFKNNVGVIHAPWELGFLHMKYFLTNTFRS